MSLAHLLLPGEGRLATGDLEILGRLAAILPNKWRVGNLFPARREQRALARFEAVSQRSWDLRWRSSVRYDALIAGRVPALSDGAGSELRNALASCALLIVLDAAAAPSSAERLLADVKVNGGSIRAYRGDWADPLLRVDDYPTGVRPILDDLSSIHAVLSSIDDSGLAFHLGVVPAILSDEMAEFLRGLKRLVVSMHGFEHGYAKHSKILIDAGDPFNQRSTVTGFDEFAGQSYPEIEATIGEGLRILESRAGQRPRSYIPPNNIGNRLTGRALRAAGFELVLAERPIWGCELPCIKSDFYGRSSDYKPELRPAVACLHATWEADMQRAGDTESLPHFLRGLLEQRRQVREQVAGVAEQIATAVVRG